jgi:hypothetical protein
MRPAFQFHWSPNPDGKPPAHFIRTCLDAEAAGIESVHVPAGIPVPEALALAIEAGARTAAVRFRIEWEFDGDRAPLFGQELKNAGDILGRRLIVHMPLQSEEPGEDLRRVCEFIAHCRGLFSESGAPRFDIEGQTANAAFAAIKQADCLWRLPHRPNQVYADALPVLHFDKEIGLIVFVIARQTREDALEAAATLLRQEVPDPARWMTHYLWSGMVAGSHIGVLAGSFEEVARAMLGFKNNGVSQVLVREWPGRNEMADFAVNVLPVVRAMESGAVN